MSEVNNGFTLQHPHLEVDEDGNVLKFESSTSSIANSNVCIDNNFETDSLDSSKKEDGNLKQDLETKPYSSPLPIDSSQICLENRDASDYVKTDVFGKPTTMKPANFNENTEESDVSNLNREESIRNDSATFEKDELHVIAPELVNLQGNIIHIKAKLMKVNEKHVADEALNQVESFQLSDICENLGKNLNRDKSINTAQEENFGTKTDKTSNITQEENFGTKTGVATNKVAQEENFDTKTDKTVNISAKEDNCSTSTDKTVNIAAKEENNSTATDKTVNIIAPEKETYNRKTDKKITGALIKEDNARTHNKIGYSGNYHTYSAESRNKGIESKVPKSEIVSDCLRNLEISDRLDNTGTIKDENANQTWKKSNYIKDLNLEKKSSSVNSLPNRKSETTSKVVNQTYLNALKHFQNLCDQPPPTMLGRKSDTYFQIRTQENKCLELGTELKNLKGYLAGVKSDIGDLKMRCSDIQTSLKNIWDK